MSFDKIIEKVKEPLADEKEIDMIEIGMLKYKDPKVETKAVEHIIKNTEHPFKLTVYDNRVNGKNLSKIWNKLIKESLCDYICLINSDAYVPEKWLRSMFKTLREEDNCYLVVPRVDNTYCPQQQANKAEDIEPTKLTTIFAAQCVLYDKKLFEKIGYFDEDFLFYGQDSEFGHRLLKSDCDGYVDNRVLVKHVGSYSINRAAKRGEYDKELERFYAKKLFKIKTNESSTRRN